MKTRAPDALRTSLFNSGDPVWIYYRTTKQNEKDEWISATVFSADKRFLVARRYKRGPQMRAAFEDVRFAPRSDLRYELLSCPLEDEIRKANDTAPREDTTTDNIDCTPVTNSPPPVLPANTEENIPLTKQSIFATDVTIRRHGDQKYVGDYSVAKKLPNSPCDNTYT